MRTRRIFGGIAIALAAAGLWAVTWLELGLHPYVTGLAAVLCAVGILGGLMVWFAEEIGAGRRF